MNNQDRAQTRRSPMRLEGQHVLLMLLAFFGVVFAVNGIFLASALRSYTGVVSNEPYVKGLKYNQRIAADERQQALGWQQQLQVDANGLVSVSFRDEAGHPVRGLKVSGSIGRPSTGRLDRFFQLTEIDPGLYVAQAGNLEPGTWVVGLEGASSESSPDPVYRLRRRVWLER